MDCFSRDSDHKNTAMKNRQYASIFDGEFIGIVQGTNHSQMYNLFVVFCFMVISHHP